MTSCDKIDYKEYSTTYDKIAYLKQLAKIKEPNFYEIINMGRIFLTDYEFEMYVSKFEDINAMGAGGALINCVCRYGTLKMLEHVISCGANLECADGYGNRPIHYVCQYGTNEMFRCIVDRGAYLVPANQNGYRPIHLIGQYGTVDMLNYMIARGVSLEYARNRGTVAGAGDRLIHIICRYGTINKLAAVIDLVDLQSVSYELPPLNFRDGILNIDDFISRGESPLEIAKRHKRDPEFLALLQSKMANHTT